MKEEFCSANNSTARIKKQHSAKEEA